MTVHLTLHVEVEDEATAVEISEQLSRQATGMALAGHATMLSIDTKSDAEWLEGQT